MISCLEIEASLRSETDSRVVEELELDDRVSETLSDDLLYES